MRFILYITILFLVACNTSSETVSKVDPILIQFQLNKSNGSQSYILPSHHDYDGVYNYLSISKKNDESCFQFVDRFKRGLHLLPYRTQILEASHNYRENLKSKIPKKSKHLPNLVITFEIKEPQKRLTEDGSLYTLSSLTLQSFDTSFKESLSCEELSEISFVAKIKLLTSKLKAEQKNETSQHE